VQFPKYRPSLISRVLFVVVVLVFVCRSVKIGLKKGFWCMAMASQLFQLPLYSNKTFDHIVQRASTVSTKTDVADTFDLDTTQRKIDSCLVVGLKVHRWTHQLRRARNRRLGSALHHEHLE